ncbi:MAG: hypothetical protein AAGM67_14050, partial [Bacteroidota bacterium]
PSVIDSLATSPDVNVAISEVYRYTNADPIDADIIEVLKQQMLQNSGDSHWTNATPAERDQYLINLMQAIAFLGESKVH